MESRSLECYLCWRVVDPAWAACCLVLLRVPHSSGWSFSFHSLALPCRFPSSSRPARSSSSGASRSPGPFSAQPCHRDCSAARSSFLGWGGDRGSSLSATGTECMQAWIASQCADSGQSMMHKSCQLISPCYQRFSRVHLLHIQSLEEIYSCRIGWG